jgi:hypothetical protein
MAQRWREGVDDSRPSFAVPGNLRGAPSQRRRKRSFVVAAIAVTALVIAAMATLVIRNNDAVPIALNTHPNSSPRSPQSGGESSQQQSPALKTYPSVTSPPIPVASPSEPVYGYCGNIANEAEARDIVTGGIAVALIRARLVGSTEAPRVASYRLLAGALPGRPGAIDNLSAPPGRYLLLLGIGGSYTALGSYGVYHLRSNHAYQQCAYVAATHYNPPERTRTGITDASQLIGLFRSALRSTSHRR